HRGPRRAFADDDLLRRKVAPLHALHHFRALHDRKPAEQLDALQKVRRLVGRFCRRRGRSRNGRCSRDNCFGWVRKVGFGRRGHGYLGSFSLWGGDLASYVSLFLAEQLMSVARQQAFRPLDSAVRRASRPHRVYMFGGWAEYTLDLVIG